MLLSSAALSSYYAMIRFGCGIHLIPYKWDAKRKQVKAVTKNALIVYYIHFTYILIMNVFAGLRLLQSIGKDATGEYQLMFKIINFIWAGAYSFTSILLVQYEVLRDDMMVFVNALLNQLEHNGSSELDQKEEDWWRKSLSKYVLIAIGLLLTNPLFHALVVPAAPCAPHFLISLVHQCQTTGESSMPFYYYVPFVIQEYYGVMVMLSTWSFNWSIIFLGLAWVLRELRITKCSINENSLTFNQYRHPELIVNALNYSAEFYLTAFPTLLYTVLALLLFGCVRLWHLDPRSNVLFPTCGIRCGFESMSPLALAGLVNKESKVLLWKWKWWKGSKYLIRFKRSCRSLRCAAGSIYTFENSIVAVSIHNLNQLTLNLLVAFR